MTFTLSSHAKLPQWKSPEQIQTSMLERMVAWGRQVFTKESSNDSKFDEMDLDDIVRMTGEW
jgi:hypothetical protein